MTHTQLLFLLWKVSYLHSLFSHRVGRHANLWTFIVDTDLRLLRQLAGVDGL